MKTGKDMVKLALKHIGEEYYLGSDVPKDDPNWHGSWDCAEFISWCVFQTIGQLFGVANDHGDPHDASGDANA